MAIIKDLFGKDKAEEGAVKLNPNMAAAKAKLEAEAAQKAAVDELRALEEQAANAQFSSNVAAAGATAAAEKAKYTLEVDGIWGELTTKTTQHIFGLEEDGIIGPLTTKAIQEKVGAVADGIWGPNTTKAMQAFLGVTADGIKGPQTISAWQKWCNEQL